MEQIHVHMHSIIDNMFAMHVHVHSHMDIIILCAGASPDIKDPLGKTPLELAEKEMHKRSDPEDKQRYEKVNEETCTITHVDIDNIC